MISGCTITRNALSGGLVFSEVIMSMLPICEEVVVGDDSDDGTWEELQAMSSVFTKIKPVKVPWPIREHREGSISIVTNQVIDMCIFPYTLHCQSDEVLDPNTLPIIQEVVRNNKHDGIVFNRVQVGRNFQEFHISGVPSDQCAPQGLIRAGKTDRLRSGGDGLGMDVRSENLYRFQWPGSNVQLWDISKCFVKNFPYRSKNCAEIWWHIPDNNKGAFFGKDYNEWMQQLELWDREGYPEIYEKRTSTLNGLPQILHGLVGEKKYFVREEFKKL